MYVVEAASAVEHDHLLSSIESHEGVNLKYLFLIVHLPASPLT